MFDDATARLLDDAYNGRDATRRRMASLSPLCLAGGERVVDLGCGAGHLTEEAARAVGPSGHVHGIDPAAAMRDKAAKRCDGRANVTISEGTAAATGLASASVDGIVAVQVFSYLTDLAAALHEARRILRPGGRLVVSDIHWGGAIWAASDPQLGREVLAFWAGQLACPDVAEHVPGLARQAGFTKVRVVPSAIVDTDMRPDGLARMLMTLIDTTAAAHGGALHDAVRAWIDDQVARQRAGRFLFSVTSFIIVLE